MEARSVDFGWESEAGKGTYIFEVEKQLSVVSDVGQSERDLMADPIGDLMADLLADLITYLRADLKS